ncbi:MAG: DegV family protein [Myxococcota bacterium]
MHILTNPGSNLAENLIEHYKLHITPQQIAVDGEYHDTRKGFPFETIDAWVQKAKKHPFVIGTSASQFANWFTDLGADGKAILAIQTSRKLIHSYNSAMTSLETFEKHGQAELARRIRVVDSLSTDVGAGLLTLLAAEARASGLGLEEIGKLLDAAAPTMRSILTLATLDNLVKGGKASFVKAWIADALNIRPVLELRDGELKAVGKVSTRADAPDKVVEYLSSMIPPGTDVWAAIAHGNNAGAARRLEERLRKTYSVRFLYLRPLSPSIYLHCGPGAVFGILLPLASLPWQPKKPPPDPV